jgi:hypothetical protein
MHPADLTKQTSAASGEQTWRRVVVDLPVTYVWAYDTVAILDDYYDSEAGTLPAGQLIRFSAAADDPSYFICDLDDPRFIERTQLPRHRVFRFRPWSSATTLQVVVAANDFHVSTDPARRPTRLRRLLRLLHRYAR